MLYFYVLHIAHCNPFFKIDSCFRQPGALWGWRVGGLRKHVFAQGTVHSCTAGYGNSGAVNEVDDHFDQSGGPIDAARRELFEDAQSCEAGWILWFDRRRHERKAREGTKVLGRGGGASN